MSVNPSPFIIWTFRRSGGTNLGQSLFLSSQFNAVEHEPFNIDRKFNYVVNNWNKNKDKEKLYSDIEEILSQNLLIKHCLEIMPEELNQALLEVSVKLGYKHLFLYRENAKSRLLSLNYSMKTNVWGKKHLLTRPFDEKVFDENIPINKLINHEKHARAEMNSLYQRLIELNACPLSVSFEQLYKSDFNYSSLLVKSLFMELIGNDDVVTNEFLDKTLKGGKQGTNDDYLRFPNSGEFLVELKRLPDFKLYESFNLNYSVSDDLTVDYVEVWPSLPSVFPNKCFFHGVFLSNKEFNIHHASGEAEFISYMRSDRIKKMYPEHQRSGNCRFIYGPVNYNDELYFTSSIND